MIATTQSLIAGLSGDQAEMMEILYASVAENLPNGFEERCDGKMIHWVVPLSTFPKGYHCTPGQPLGMISLAAGKQGVTLHHFGLYMQPHLLEEFRSEVETETGSRADMGKACLKMNKPAKFAPNAIAKLMRRISLEEFVAHYVMALGARGK